MVNLIKVTKEEDVIMKSELKRMSKPIETKKF